MKKSLVYTRTGDKGKTSLVGGKRVEKSHIRLEAYGTIDELNSFIGLLICEIKEQQDLDTLFLIQNKLFNVGAYLATDMESTNGKVTCNVGEKDIETLEKEIDRLDSLLPALKQFVLPGGSESSARAHICRTVCRRAERIIFRVKAEYEVEDTILRFVNRLSDYLFVLARYESIKNGKEIFWNNSCS